MDEFRLYVLVNNTSVISGRWEGDNVRYAMEPLLRSEPNRPGLLGLLDYFVHFPTLSGMSLFCPLGTHVPPPVYISYRYNIQ